MDLIIIILLHSTLNLQTFTKLVQRFRKHFITPLLLQKIVFIPMAIRNRKVYILLYNIFTTHFVTVSTAEDNENDKWQKWFSNLTKGNDFDISDVGGALNYKTRKQYKNWYYRALFSPLFYLLTKAYPVMSACPGFIFSWTVTDANVDFIAQLINYNTAAKVAT